MRAVQVTEERGLAEGELPDPEPGAGEVVVEIAFCGICGSDLHMLPSPAIAPGSRHGPRVLGQHLGARATGSRAGRSATASRCCRGRPAGSAPSARPTSEHLCMQGVIRGHGLGGRPGAYAERVAVSAESLFALPDSVSDEHGALVEPLAVGVHAETLAEFGARRSRLRAGGGADRGDDGAGAPRRRSGADRRRRARRASPRAHRGAGLHRDPARGRARGADRRARRRAAGGGVRVRRPSRGARAWRWSWSRPPARSSPAACSRSPSRSTSCC